MAENLPLQEGNSLFKREFTILLSTLVPTQEKKKRDEEYDGLLVGDFCVGPRESGRSGLYKDETVLRRPSSVTALHNRTYCLFVSILLLTVGEHFRQSSVT